MKTIILLIISLCFASFTFALPNDCNLLQPVLEQFYQSSKQEKIDDYLKIIDIDYVKENMLENYEDYVKSAWEVYDITDYKISIYNCKIENNNGIIYFNLFSKIKGEEGEQEQQRNYIGVMSKTDSRKIRYVIDEELMDQYQDIKNSNIYLQAIKDVIDADTSKVESLAKEIETVSNFEKEINSTDNSDQNTTQTSDEKNNENGTQSTNKSSEDNEYKNSDGKNMKDIINDYEKKHSNNGFMYFGLAIVLLIIVVGLGFIIYKKKK